MVERLRPFDAFAFVSLTVDEMSSSDEYLVAYSVSRLNFDFSLSMRLRSRLIRILRVVLVTGIFGAPNCAKRYCSSSLLSSVKSSISAASVSVGWSVGPCFQKSLACVYFTGFWFSYFSHLFFL